MTETTTTPLVAEDLLLLLFDPASGTFRGEGSALFHALAGAVLSELALTGQVQVGERTFMHGQEVRAVGDPPADPLLGSTWHRLQKRPTDAYALILEIGPTLRAGFVERLEERGHLRQEPRRFLGLIPTTALVSGDTSRRDELLDLVRPVLVDGVQPDQRTAALAALLSASGALPAMHREIPWSGDVYTRGVALQKGHWGAASADEAVARTAAAILANNLFLSLTLPGLRDD